MREVAIYAEFGFEGALIASNIIDGAAIGVVGDEFQRRRTAGRHPRQHHPQSVAQRPAGTDPGDAAGIGIAAEADTAITGNVIENAPTAGCARAGALSA